MISYRDLVHVLGDLDLSRYSRVLLHAHPSALLQVSGGGESLVGAILAGCQALMTPAFTRRCQVVPEVGPADNAIDYGAAAGQNSLAEVYRRELAADDDLQPLAEIVRLRVNERSRHPLLSFAGVNVVEGLASQTLDLPWAPIAWLADNDADVVLFGGDHRQNVSLHYAEQLAGRKSFLRWALTPRGVVACPRFPGCAEGFAQVAPRLKGIARWARFGDLAIESVPLRDLLNVAAGWIRENPRALLCDREGCRYCAAVRAAVRAPGPTEGKA